MTKSQEKSGKSLVFLLQEENKTSFFTDSDPGAGVYTGP